VNTWRVILATLLIFGAGVVTGGLLVSHTIRTTQSRPRSFNGQLLTPWHFQTRELLRRMGRDLDLTPEQRQHIEKIIADSQERTKAIWKPISQSMGREIQRVHGEIRDQLTPGQQQKYDVLIKQRSGRRTEERRRSSSPNPATNAITLSTNSVSTNLPAAQP